MINEIIKELNQDPAHILSAAILKQHLVAIAERSKIDFETLEVKDGELRRAVVRLQEESFPMLGD